MKRATKAFLAIFALGLVGEAGQPSRCLLQLMAPDSQGTRKILNRTYTNEATGIAAEDPVLEFDTFGNAATVMIFVRDNGKLDSIGYLSATVEDGTARVGVAKVSKDFRKKGLQDDLFEFLLREFPKVEKISTELTGTNEEVIAQSFLAFAGGTVEKGDRGDPIVALNRCCRAFMDEVRKDPQRLDQMVQAAIEKTPAYRSRKKLGFGKFCEKPTPKFKVVDGLLYPDFTLLVCRDG